MGHELVWISNRLLTDRTGFESLMTYQFMNDNLISRERAQELYKKWERLLEASFSSSAKCILIEGQERWITKEDLKPSETKVGE